MSKKHLPPSRRLFLQRSAKLAIAGAALPFVRPAVAAVPRPRALAFDHTHTGEQISIVYAKGEHYVPDALRRLNHFMRDHYSGEVGRMDPRLFDLLYRLQRELGTSESFHVISAYRCPQTNANLRKTGGGGVARRSLHMDGQALDIRLPGTPLTDLRDAALSLRGGGVGFYPREQFVHVDIGRVRSW